LRGDFDGSVWKVRPDAKEALDEGASRRVDDVVEVKTAVVCASRFCSEA